VLFDAVALVLDQDEAEVLAWMPEARNFVSDAAAHKKFIGHVGGAEPLMKQAGVIETDGGFVSLATSADSRRFVEACRKLRFWDRKG